MDSLEDSREGSSRQVMLVRVFPTQFITCCISKTPDPNFILVGSFEIRIEPFLESMQRIHVKKINRPRYQIYVEKVFIVILLPTNSQKN